MDSRHEHGFKTRIDYDSQGLILLFKRDSSSKWLKYQDLEDLSDELPSPSECLPLQDLASDVLSQCRNGTV